MSTQVITDESEQLIPPKPLNEEEEASTAWIWIVLILAFFGISIFIAHDEARKVEEARVTAPIGQEDVKNQFAPRRNLTAFPPELPSNPLTPDGLYPTRAGRDPSHIANIMDLNIEYNRIAPLLHFGVPSHNIMFRKFKRAQTTPDFRHNLIKVDHRHQHILSRLWECYCFTTSPSNCEYTAMWDTVIDISKLCVDHPSKYIKAFLCSINAIGYIEYGEVIVPVTSIHFGRTPSLKRTLNFPIRFLSIPTLKPTIELGSILVLSNNSSSMTRLGVDYDIVNSLGAISSTTGILKPSSWTAQLYTQTHNGATANIPDHEMVIVDESGNPVPITFRSNLYRRLVTKRVNIHNTTNTILKEWIV